mmetsp:Transcript_11453/g.44533  ORF Transcript_11453/g.44533 Transcript_11453/m.44533 type:complete len:91 (+) Transcript_11453:1437-1709(+)
MPSSPAPCATCVAGHANGASAPAPAAAAAAVGTSVDTGPDPLMAMLAGDFQPAAGFKSSDSAPELVEVVKIHSAPNVKDEDATDVLAEPA